MGSSKPFWTDQFQIKLSGPKETTLLHIYLFNDEKFDKLSTYGHILRLTDDNNEPGVDYGDEEDSNADRKHIPQHKKKQRIPASSRELIDSVDGIDIEKYLRRNPNGKIKIPMKYKKAFICIDVEEDHSSTNKNYLKGFMRLHLRGIGIRNVEGGLLQGLTPVAQKKAYQVWYTSNPFLEYL